MSVESVEVLRGAELTYSARLDSSVGTSRWSFLVAIRRRFSRDIHSGAGGFGVAPHDIVLG